MSEYNAVIHMDQGSTQLTVEDGGSVYFEDGGTLVYEVVTDTTAANLENSGVSSIANASSGLSTFILDAPAAGVVKYISCDGSFGSTAIGYIDAGSGVSIGSTQRYMSIKSAYASMALLGVTTTYWSLIAAEGSTVSTGSTA